MTKKILIIGAGIAGLSAGIHALQNGYEAEIYEKHNLPGGLCTAWERKGYTFDGCIHWLVGTKKGSQFNHFWQEVCDLNSLPIIEHDRFMTVEGSSGKVLHFYCDLDKLEQHLLEYSPADRDLIMEITTAARQMSAMKFPLEKPMELMRVWDMPGLLLKTMPMFKMMGKFSRLTIAEYISAMKDPFLREALMLMIPAGYSMISLISTLASHHGRDAGFPQGGSLNFARMLEKRFKDLGGIVQYSSPVTEIKIKKDRALGVILDDGREVAGDIIISAADLYHSLYDLLKGKYLTAHIKESFKDFSTYTSVQVSLGIDADLSGEDYKLAVKLDQPISLGAEQNNYLYLTNYAFDTTLAPAGKCVLGATLYSTYEYWQGIAGNRELYRQRKEDLAEQVIKVAEKRFPAVRRKVEVIDVATPHTYHRYTNVYKGAYMAWIIPPDSGRFRIPKQIPGLEGYYQIGQWVEPPSGLPGSMLTGRQVVQLVCSADKRKFIAG